MVYDGTKYGLNNQCGHLGLAKHQLKTIYVVLNLGLSCVTLM
jgi:hypothetical protein